MKPREMKMTMAGALRKCDHCGNDTFWQDSAGETFCKFCNYNITSRAVPWHSEDPSTATKEQS